ncbi:MAG: aldehyde dehydrogenase (NADP(+)) [Phycisphaerae bacterium]|jgi:NADP-dependent aldehyde dehydrogenase|nr:aldehyde dehydrogenase (NADP(+)) [Phycisphaerae bacterium]
MDLTGQQIIGQSRSAEGPETFTATNPATGETLPAVFHHATSGELDKACALADAAVEALEKKTPEEIAVFLDKVAEEIMNLGDALIARANQETGLPEGRFQGERGRTCGQLGLFASLIREGSWVDARIETAMPDRTPFPKPDLRLMRRPLGPVVVFCASNFPLAFSVAGGDTASAWAAGCPVIVKAHHAHPGTAELVGLAIQKAAAATNMPEGIFSLLYGPGRSIGMDLVKHPTVKAVGFTGSQQGGRALFDAAAARPDPIPVYAEMSSINPVFILPEALKENAEQIAAGLRQSVTLGVGQFCTCPGVLVMLAGEETDAFLTRTAGLLAESSRDTMLTAGIFDAYRTGFEKLDNKDTVTLLGHDTVTFEAAGNRAVPALFRTDATTFLADDELSEELFGPTTLAVVCSSDDELFKVARKFRGELTATLHGSQADLDAYSDLLPIMSARAGRLLVGGYPTGVEVCSAMNHGGPYPACTDSHYTSVGTGAILRFSRPICLQNVPDACLPTALQNSNPDGLWRLINGVMTKDSVQ